MTPCPKCQGRPVSGFMLVNRGDGDCTLEPSRGCSVCGGTGEITEAHAAHYQTARRWRRQRIDVGTDTLRSAGQRWGVSPAVVSKAENYGIGDPWIFERMAAELAESTESEAQRA